MQLLALLTTLLAVPVQDAEEKKATYTLTVKVDGVV